MKIGDRVTYNEDRGGLRQHEDLLGTIAEPTVEELQAARAADGGIGEEWGDVLVAWDDGERYWEHPSYLVLLPGADS